MSELRNICIIAHVDHGKTTLVDHLLRQAGTFQAHQALNDRVMDSGDLERERGITILAKNTSVRVGDTKINIVDTPGHADFGGEVERIMGMVDGAILLVDAAEGPLPQTRFVLQKALAQGHKVILVINKVDRPECKDMLRIHEVVDMVFDLFVELGAGDKQLEFPILYACGREGWCTTKTEEIGGLIAKTIKGSLKPLFDTVLAEVSPPKTRTGDDFQMMISNLSYNDYVGRLAIGRVFSGTVKKNQKITKQGVRVEYVTETVNGEHVTHTKEVPAPQTFVVSQVFTFDGLRQVEVPELSAGDIGTIAGTEDFQIGDTLASNPEIPPLPRIKVEPPTLGMIFSVNTSPLAGLEGEAIQSRKLRERLLREVRQNVALRLEETPLPDQFRVLGRGELQLAILIEQMRREGFEFMVGKPTVIIRKNELGESIEPLERAVLDLPEEYASEVTRLFQERKGILTKYEAMNPPRVRLEIETPTRGLLGIRSRYLTTTRGTGLFNTELIGFTPFKGELKHRQNGALISDRLGKTVEYALMTIEERGQLFFGSGVDVYEGMIIGENAKDGDMNVNCCREKKLTNIRSAGAEFLVTLRGARDMSLEKSIEWITEEEWIEVTPKSVRIRKKILPLNLRK